MHHLNSQKILMDSLHEQAIVKILRPLMVAVYDVTQTKPEVTKVLDETISNLKGLVVTCMGAERQVIVEKCSKIMGVHESPHTSENCRLCQILAINSDK